jgi:hypothetical protein
MVTLALRAIKQDQSPYGIFILKNGFEKLWNTIVDKEKLNIVYNVDIVGVQQSQGNEGVLIQKWENSRIVDEMCDFMIWTPPMSELLRVQQHSTKQERQLFSGLRPAIYIASVVDSKGEVRHGPGTVFMANVNTKAENGLMVLVDTAGIQDNPDISTAEGLARYNNLGRRRTAMYLQMAKNKTNEVAVTQKLKEQLEQGFNMKDADILATRSWSYFPRWAKARHQPLLREVGAGTDGGGASLAGVRHAGNLLFSPFFSPSISPFFLPSIPIPPSN